MKKKILFFAFLAITPLYLYGQNDSLPSVDVTKRGDSRQTETVTKSQSNPYAVKSAFEVESLVPMFLTGGYHFAVCYRYERFRVRFSVINGGMYDAEKAGLHNSSAHYSRFYKTSPGVFLGYNIWNGLELYTYLESHTFEIEQKSTGIRKDLHSYDTGLGLSYQFFIGNSFYIQPGMHLYLRGDKTIDFPTGSYSIPNVDLSAVIRLGFRLWSQRD